jgi:hypothetical protein
MFVYGLTSCLATATNDAPIFHVRFVLVKYKCTQIMLPIYYYQVLQVQYIPVTGTVVRTLISESLLIHRSPIT